MTQDNSNDITVTPVDAENNDLNLIQNNNIKSPFCKIFVGGQSPDTHSKSLTVAFLKVFDITDPIMLKSIYSKVKIGYAHIILPREYYEMIEDEIEKREICVNGKNLKLHTSISKKKMAKKLKENILKKIFVGRIEDSITEEQLVAHFSQFGEIEIINIILKVLDSSRRGFAFIQYKDAISVDASLKCNHHKVNGITLVVGNCFPKFNGKHQKMEELKREVMKGKTAYMDNQNTNAYYQQGQANEYSYNKFRDGYSGNQSTANTNDYSYWSPQNHPVNYQNLDNTRLKTGSVREIPKTFNEYCGANSNNNLQANLKYTELHPYDYVEEKSQNGYYQRYPQTQNKLSLSNTEYYQYENEYAYDPRGYQAYHSPNNQYYDQTEYDQVAYDQAHYDQTAYDPAHYDQAVYDPAHYGQALQDKASYDQTAYDQTAYYQGIEYEKDYNQTYESYNQNKVSYEGYEYDENYYNKINTQSNENDYYYYNRSPGYPTTLHSHANQIQGNYEDYTQCQN